jgi:hypothetical protein
VGLLGPGLDALARLMAIREAGGASVEEDDVVQLDEIAPEIAEEEP